MTAMPSLKALSAGAVDFIDEDKLHGLLSLPAPTAAEVRAVIAKSLDKQALTVEETAVLLRADSPELIEEIFQAARDLKRRVYGNRIVLFAPLYVGSDCVNDCKYCSFQRSNTETVRRSLSLDELEKQVKALEDRGHKRLILVWGEDPKYTPEHMAECVRKVYATKSGPGGEIRRVNINAAPLDVEGYKTIKAAGIGTYQIFQETYHHATYARMHPANTRKGNYLWRLDGLSRAFEAGCDDMGIGALFGLYDWRFEVLGLVTHATHLKAKYNVGPHTISFPRIKAACGVDLNPEYQVSDENFKRLVAVLRLAVPYTGLIMTAREPAHIRRAVLAFGVSQIDAGSRIEIGGYTEAGDAQVVEREQFTLGDMRSLDEVIRELLENDYVPSFCTACYRLGRTGEHFMEFAIPGFIKKFCTPNALTTLQEYLSDYASPETRAAGERLIQRELARMEEGTMKEKTVEKMGQIRETGKRDFYV